MMNSESPQRPRGSGRRNFWNASAESRQNCKAHEVSAGFLFLLHLAMKAIFQRNLSCFDLLLKMKKAHHFKLMSLGTSVLVAIVLPSMIRFCSAGSKFKD
mmetsp:Transcript_79325/g.116276  ORF Transcript_79325/g.116276 Transcript_79325/m.116276 type:complete len:100 (+) Transcript_79325:256-555(+)